jgi:hypothetical protein
VDGELAVLAGAGADYPVTLAEAAPQVARDRGEDGRLSSTTRITGRLRFNSLMART